jgi:hypothetical protein
MRSSLLNAVLLVSAVSMTVSIAAPLTASAQPFSGSRLFVNHSMKVKMDRTFGIGADFTVAPVKAAQQVLVKQFREQYPEGAAAMMTASQYVSPEDIQSLNNDISGLPALLEASGAPLTEEQKTQIREGVAAAESAGADAQMMSDIIQIMSEPDTTITFSLEPHMWLHFDPVDIYFTVPVAGFFGDTTEFAFGNIGVDAKFGHTWGEDFSFGLSYGAQWWAPTATAQANALGLGNLAWSPRYFSQYTSISPYLVIAGDLKFVTLQANIAYMGMFGVKGDPVHDQVQYLQWGGSFSVTAIPFTILSAEISGLTGIENADAYNSIFLTAGLRFVARIVDIGLGAQIPLVKAESSDLAAFSNLAFGGPADINVILSFTIGI